jgi:branched-subunit amino acid aminotransferase/4-amino-4-deoxychorismate lyase
MEPTKAQYLFLNGGFAPYDEAKIHVLTPAMKYGATVYEGIRGYFEEENSNIYLFRLDDHLKRLFQSMEMAWMKPPYSLDEFRQDTIDTVRKNEFHQDIHIRLMVFVQSDDGSMTSQEPVGVAIAAFQWTEVRASRKQVSIVGSALGGEFQMPLLRRGLSARVITKIAGSRESRRPITDTTTS